MIGMIVNKSNVLTTVIILSFFDISSNKSDINRKKRIILLK